MSKTKNKNKVKKLSLKEAKLEVARLGLIVAQQYDKRFINTWLYSLGDTTVEPVLRTSIVHKPRKKKKELSWNDLTNLVD